MDIGSLTGRIELEDQLTHTLELGVHHIKQFTTHFEGMTGVVLAGAGIVTAAVAGIVGAVVGLGVKGSTILGVEDAFNRLAVAAGSTGERMESALTRGVRGTVDSMELMQATTRLLSSGLKVTDSDLLLMAKTAREVGKATGTDAASGLNILSGAMLTGNARMLKRYGIQIDLVKAEKEFRAAHDGTTAALSASGKLEVNRLAVLEGMRVKLEKLGESELSFKERIQQATVSVGNWFDSLAKAVASSPHVLQAFDSIGSAILKAFGGTSQDLLDFVVKWINRFADFAGRYGPQIIGWLVGIKDKIVAIWHTVSEAWDLVPDWFKRIAKDAALAGGAVYLANKAIGAIGGGGGSDLLGTIASFATITSGLRDFTSVAISTVPKAIIQVKGIYSALSLFYAFGSFAGGGVLGGLGAVLSGIGAAVAGIVATPLFALAAGITAVYAAFKVGQMEAVQDWFEALELYAEGMTMAEAKAAVAQHRMFDRATEAAKGLAALRKEVEGAARGLGHSTTSATVPDKPEAPTDPFADTMGDKVKALLKSYQEAGQSVAVFTSAFRQLTPAQKDNFTVQQMLVGEMDKMLAAHIALTPAMEEVYRNSIQLNQAYLADETAALERSGVTLAQIDSLKLLGVSEKDIAFLFGVSTEALHMRTAAMQKALGEERALASFSEAFAEQERQTAKRRQDVALAADKAIADSQLELDDLIKKSSMTTTAYEISKIQEEEAARITAFSATGASAAAVRDYSELQKRISHERVQALFIDNDALKNNSRATLEDIRDRAWNTYKAMKAAPEEYSQAAIEASHQIALHASKDADITRTKWDEAWDDLKEQLKGIATETGQNIAGLLGDGIKTGDWSQFENNLKDALANGMGAAAAAAVNAVVPGLGTILEPIFGALSDKLLGALGLGTKGRDMVKDFAASFLKAGDLSAGITGFDRLHEELMKLGSEGERLWINLTQGVGRNNPQQALLAIDAIRGALANMPEIGPTMSERAASAGFHTVAELKATAAEAVSLWEYMRDSGLYTADAVQQAWERAQDALIASGDAGAIAAKKAKDAIGKLKDELASFADSLQAEADAPEYDEMGNRIYGVVEAQQMARKAQIEAEMAAIAEQQNAAQDAIDATASTAVDATADAAQSSADAAVGILDETLAAHRFVARLEFEYDLPNITIPAKAREPEDMAGGGTVVWRPSGSDTVPAMLTPGERVIPRGGAGRDDDTQTIVVKIGERVIAKTAVRGMPRELYVQGV